jgi:N-acetyl-anhydromuramyl-L-alanine amidase AmpD
MGVNGDPLKGLYMRNIDLIVVHCSATPEGRDVSTEEIRQWHLDRGWSDIGYHFVIELDGAVYDGRSVELAGAHAKSYNQNSIGVCYVGGTDDDLEAKDTRTEEQKEALIELLTKLKADYPGCEIIGHKDISDKECPSFDVAEEYKDL